MATQMCRGFTDAQWRGLRPRLDTGEQVAWDCAIAVFERRINERFLSYIETLVHADSKADVEAIPDVPADCSTLPSNTGQVVVPGFAILGLCCLLAETLQGFREKPAKAQPVSGACTYHLDRKCIKPATTDQFREFLRRPALQNAFADDSVARSFVNGVRNGIFHEAETRGWLMWRDEPPGKIVGAEGEQYALNRNEFYRALQKEFEGYVAELRDPSNSDLRKRFIKKMTDIAKEC